MRILLTNDDGIHADGLNSLERVARQLTDDVWIVAPQTDQSGVAHSLSLHNPLRMSVLGNRRYSVKGTPTDCVIMAVDKLMDKKPDLILSGINMGLNVADDVSYSGTVAAAIEGTLLGIKSIALSQAVGGTDTNESLFSVSEHFSPELIRKLIEFDIPRGTYFNVNFPNCPHKDVGPVKFTVQGKKNWNSLFIDERRDNWGSPYYWIAFQGKKTELQEESDLYSLRQGCISVTPLQIDMTDYRVFQSLSNGESLLKAESLPNTESLSAQASA